MLDKRHYALHKENINYFVPFNRSENLLQLRLLNDIITVYPEYTKYKNARIALVYGTFNECMWNGGRPYHETGIGEGNLTLEEMKAYVEYVNEMGMAFRLIFSNRVLLPDMLGDKYCNSALDAIDNGFGNEVVVASDLLREYIKKTHPNLRLVASITRGNDPKLYIEELKDDWDVVVIHPRQSVLDFISTLDEEDKYRVEVLMNHDCTYCPIYDYHFIAHSMDNLGLGKAPFMCYRQMPWYSKEVQEALDKKALEDPDIGDWDTVINKYGIKNFKLQGRAHEKYVFDTVIPTILDSNKVDINEICDIVLDTAKQFKY